MLHPECRELNTRRQVGVCTRYSNRIAAHPVAAGWDRALVSKADELMKDQTCNADARDCENGQSVGVVYHGWVLH